MRVHGPGRRSGFALVAAGVLCAVIAASGWRAGPAGAAPLFSFDLRAGAHGFRLFVADPANGDQEGAVATTRANFANGPVGYGLATVAWPGPLLANLGTLLLVASSDVPPEAKLLDYPIRAEARTGQSPATTTFDAVPGTSLSASVEDAGVRADAVVGGVDGDAGPIGSISARSRTAEDDGVGTAESSSVVRDISLAEGVVEIRAVVSRASARTDGRKGDGTASTVVTGLTVAGQSVTVDENGLHVGAEGQPANAVVNQIVREALTSAGIEIVLSAPTREVTGPAASLTAGSLVVGWETPDRAFTVVFGGAQANVTGSPGADDLTEATGGDAGAIVPAPSAGDGGDGVTVDAVPSPTLDGVAAPTADPASARAPSDVGAVPAVAVFAEGLPVRPGAVVLALIAAGLLATGLWRLSAPVLGATASAACPLEEQG